MRIPGMATTSAPSRPLRRLALTGCALLLVAAAACGDDEDDPVSAGDGTTVTTAAPSEATSTTASSPDYGGAGGGGASTGATIEAADFTFTSATVAAGAEVTVDNADSAPHTVTADDGAFDSGRVEGGSSATLTAPSEPGEFTFHCEIHPDMTGTLTVEG